MVGRQEVSGPLGFQGFSALNSGGVCLNMGGKKNTSLQVRTFVIFGIDCDQISHDLNVSKDYVI